MEVLLLALLVLAAAAAGVALARARSLRRRCRALEGEQRRLLEQAEGLREAERRSREEAERAARSRDEFVATVSHELRTPLNAVLGWARLLRLGQLDPAAAARAVETI